MADESSAEETRFNDPLFKHLWERDTAISDGDVIVNLSSCSADQRDARLWRPPRTMTVTEVRRAREAVWMPCRTCSACRQRRCSPEMW